VTICCDFAECFADLFLIVCRLLFGEEGKKLDGIWAFFWEQMEYGHNKWHQQGMYIPAH
jgi:hypothetical protein